MHLEPAAARKTVDTWHAIILSAGLMKLCLRWSLLAYNFLLLCILADLSIADEKLLLQSLKAGLEFGLVF